jgi:hypothetical protein
LNDASRVSADHGFTTRRSGQDAPAFLAVTQQEQWKLQELRLAVEETFVVELEVEEPVYIRAVVELEVQEPLWLRSIFNPVFVQPLLDTQQVRCAQRVPARGERFLDSRAEGQESVQRQQQRPERFAQS